MHSWTNDPHLQSKLNPNMRMDAWGTTELQGTSKGVPASPLPTAVSETMGACIYSVCRQDIHTSIGPLEALKTTFWLRSTTPGNNNHLVTELWEGPTANQNTVPADQLWISANEDTSSSHSGKVQKRKHHVYEISSNSCFHLGWTKWQAESWGKSKSGNTEVLTKEDGVFWLFFVLFFDFCFCRHCFCNSIMWIWSMGYFIDDNHVTCQ